MAGGETESISVETEQPLNAVYSGTYLSKLV
jgi:hypothetical protein